MTLDGDKRPDVDQVLAGLKDFQRATVDYVFRRLYLDSDRTSRFLIADEVGLGKTLVARGVIARAIDHVWDSVGRIDVVYICSNQDIARQNIDRLNITRERDFQFASRSTLLPVRLQALRGNKLNFVSLTPGTSFNLRSRAGWMHERAVLYYLLRGAWDVYTPVLRNVMRGDVLKDNWQRHLRQFQASQRRRNPNLIQLDQELAQAFHAELETRPDLLERYQAIAGKIGNRRIRIPREVRRERNSLIGDLRRLLAHSSLSALEPDLVILDEFQRFKHLLEETDEAALLAQELFDFPDVKVLLLSATPYKMYTVQGEHGENHYEDFIQTASFLLKDDPEQVASLEACIEAYRNGMLRLGPEGRRDMQAAKDEIESILRRVMVRTERLAVSSDRNGMLTERVAGQGEVEPADLLSFTHLDRIAQAVDAGDQLEYWKSSAYPLNLMEGYKLKRQLAKSLETTDLSDNLASLLVDAESHLLHWASFQAYDSLDPGNARLRSLMEDTIETNNWQLLWMPPSLPYYRAPGPFEDTDHQGHTKTLVFSAWRLVPKAIAMLTSYAAERRMLDASQLDFEYGELTQRRRPLLRFNRSEGKPAGVSVFCLTYPCLTLARHIDPLAIAWGLGDARLPNLDQVYHVVHGLVARLLEEATAGLLLVDSGPPDERWHWAAPALLDRHFNRQPVDEWFAEADEALTWERMVSGDAEDPEETAFAEHVQLFKQMYHHPQDLGRQPDDLVDVLALIALGGPAVATLRALLRVVPTGTTSDQSKFLAEAARAGAGFRTLFNQPEAIILLDRLYPEMPYWLKALTYAQDGNLQAVLDEYFHVLVESLGLIEHDAPETVAKMIAALNQALSLRAPTLRFDEILVTDVEGAIQVEKRGIRCRYALRFGDEKSADYDGRTRDVDVRVAFNSPFRPFILATTSIGQEGLDFHQYCHRVVHWNLPSNPVDLEQREGRVHRYKGHVIRRNLALRYGLDGVEAAGARLVDPWQQLFQRAVEDRAPNSSDLRPFWIYETEGGYSIERIVPVLPLSREIARMAWLKRSLVAYRSVIGQPRQEELLEYLASRLAASDMESMATELAIDLSPPNVRSYAIST